MNEQECGAYFFGPLCICHFVDDTHTSDTEAFMCLFIDVDHVARSHVT